jgi:hypothetical protein
MNEMKTEKTSSDSQNQQHVSEVDEFNVDYLRKKFPWFSEDDIQKAIELKGPYVEHVVSYLDEKSGTRKIFEDPED